MKICIPKEQHPNETRVPVNPATVEKMVKLGAEVAIEAGLGTTCSFSDSEYQQAGAQVVADRKTLLESADLVLRMRKPPAEELAWMKSGTIHISHLDPFNEKDLLKAMAQQGLSSISMEMIPRTTLAQKMDALSSQMNLAGYVAVVMAAEQLNKVLPMMTTPAGTISPARIFIIGVGVAGLQAIATAKRMGARVEAFDTRPVVEEQVKSLGAKFVKIDLGDTGQTDQGYAKELTPEQLAKQQEAQAKVCEQSDIVITTAKLFGRKAPILIRKDVIARMKPGSIIVDLAAEGGGNVEGTVLNETVTTENGVTIIGLENFPGEVPVHASQVYAANLFNLLHHFWDAEQKAFILKREDEIMKGCLVTHGGEIVQEMLK